MNGKRTAEISELSGRMQIQTPIIHMQKHDMNNGPALACNVRHFDWIIMSYILDFLLHLSLFFALHSRIVFQFHMLSLLNHQTGNDWENKKERAFSEKKGDFALQFMIVRVGLSKKSRLQNHCVNCVLTSWLAKSERVNALWIFHCVLVS